MEDVGDFPNDNPKQCGEEEPKPNNEIGEPASEVNHEEDVTNNNGEEGEPASEANHEEDVTNNNHETSNTELIESKLGVDECDMESKDESCDEDKERDVEALQENTEPNELTEEECLPLTELLEMYPREGLLQQEHIRLVNHLRSMKTLCWINAQGFLTLLAPNGDYTYAGIQYPLPKHSSRSSLALRANNKGKPTIKPRSESRGVKRKETTKTEELPQSNKDDVPKKRGRKKQDTAPETNESSTKMRTKSALVKLAVKTCKPMAKPAVSQATTRKRRSKTKDTSKKIKSKTTVKVKTKVKDPSKKRKKVQINQEPKIRSSKDDAEEISSTTSTSSSSSSSSSSSGRELSKSKPISTIKFKPKAPPLLTGLKLKSSGKANNYEAEKKEQLKSRLFVNDPCPNAKPASQSPVISKETPVQCLWRLGGDLMTAKPALTQTNILPPPPPYIDEPEHPPPPEYTDSLTLHEQDEWRQRLQKQQRQWESLRQNRPTTATTNSTATPTVTIISTRYEENKEENKAQNYWSRYWGVKEIIQKTNTSTTSTVSLQPPSSPMSTNQNVSESTPETSKLSTPPASDAFPSIFKSNAFGQVPSTFVQDNFISRSSGPRLNDLPPPPAYEEQIQTFSTKDSDPKITIFS